MHIFFSTIKTSKKINFLNQIHKNPADNTPHTIKVNINKINKEITLKAYYYLQQPYQQNTQLIGHI
jgi:hypothetical protein